MNLLKKCLTTIAEVPSRAEEIPTSIGHLSGPEYMNILLCLKTLDVGSQMFHFTSKFLAFIKVQSKTPFPLTFSGMQ